MNLFKNENRIIRLVNSYIKTIDLVNLDNGWLGMDVNFHSVNFENGTTTANVTPIAVDPLMLVSKNNNTDNDGVTYHDLTTGANSELELNPTYKYVNSGWR